MTQTKTPKIQEALSIHEHLVRIQQELKAPKGQTNAFGNYQYRNCEDIIEAVKPLLNGCALLISDDIINIGDRYYVKATASLTNGKETVSTSAFAREAEQKKGMDDSQITGSASSYARKYALNGLFAIDDTRDADSKDNRQETQKDAGKPTQNAVKTQERQVSTTDKILLTCDTCGKPAVEKDGIGKTGKPYHGVFCSSGEYSHTKWGKAITPQQETIDDVPVPEE